MTTQARSQPRAARGLEWVLAALLWLHASAALIARFPQEPGLDFYHFWGIGAARALSAESLSNPYLDALRYASVLNRAAAASDDRHLQRANAQRRDPTPGSAQLFDPTSTPLAYFIFAALPLDYSAAHSVFRALQLSAGAAAIALLLVQLGVALPRAALAAAALALCYRPLAIDWNVGNLNAFQLCGAALLLRLAARAPTGPAPRALTPSEHALWAGLAGFALFKPNFAPLALGLAVALALRRGRTAALRGAATAAIAALVLIALTSLWLGSLSAWPDWARTLAGPSGEKLAEYPIGSGNHSAVVLLAHATGLPTAAQSLLHSSTLLASLWLALRQRLPVGHPGLRALADPFAAASLGALLVFLAAPLVWNHYAVLLLLPAAWLLARGVRAPRVLPAASLLAFALVAGGLDALLGLLGAEFQRVRVWLLALCALPLWLHTLATLRIGSPQTFVLGESLHTSARDVLERAA